MFTASLNDISGRVQKSLFGKKYVTKRIHDYKMILDLHDPGISRSLILFGTREVDHKVMLEKVLKPGMAVLDIGANIGYYALMELGLVGPTGSLTAIEPSPANVAMLKKNLALNGYEGKVRVKEGAVSDKRSRRKFHLATHSNLNTFHDTGTGVEHLSGTSINVETYTVPELVEDGKLDLIRMDVEGHEVEVLNGLIPAVEDGALQPMIIFETHLSRYSADHDMEAVLRKLFALGYYTRLLSSSSQRGTKVVDAKGYKGSAPIETDGMTRVIYENISDEDAIEFICKTGGARTVLLDKK